MTELNTVEVEVVSGAIAWERGWNAFLDYYNGDGGVWEAAKVGISQAWYN